MSLLEAVQIVAYYDGYMDAFNPCGGGLDKDPTLQEYLSIDKLVEVWAKMKDIGFTLRFDKGSWAVDHNYFLIDSVNDEYGRPMPDGNTLQERLVIATALAINELRENR